MELLEVVDGENQQLMPGPAKGSPDQGTKPKHLDPDNDSGQGSYDTPSLLSNNSEEPQEHPSTFHTPVGTEKPENPERNGAHAWDPQSASLEGKTPYFYASGPKSSTWPSSQLRSQHSPRSSYHNVADVCKLAMGTAGALAALLDKTDTHARTSLKTPEAGGEGKAAGRKEVGSFHSKADADTPWLRPQEKISFISDKPLDYVEIHKIGRDGALALFPKQKENGSQTENPGAPKTRKEDTKVPRVMDNNVLVLVRDLPAQNLTLLEGPAEPAPPPLQQNQEEKDLASLTTTPSNCRLPLGGLDYLDPTCLKHSFQ